MMTRNMMFRTVKQIRFHAANKICAFIDIALCIVAERSTAVYPRNRLRHHSKQISKKFDGQLELRTKVLTNHFGWHIVDG